MVFAEHLPYTTNNKTLDLTSEEKAWLKNNPIITIGEAPTFEPLLIEQDNGRITGIIPDLYDEISHRTGLTFKYVSNNWQDTISTLKNKELDVIGVMNSGIAQSNKFISIKSPFNLYTTAFAKKNSGIILNQDEDIDGLRIVYTKDTLYVERYLKSFDGNLALIKANNALEAYKLVIDGKADIMVGLNIDSYTLTKNSILEIEPIYAFKNLKTNAVLAFNSESEMLKNIMAKAISTIDSKTLEMILTNWTWIPNKETRRLQLTREEENYLLTHPVLKVPNVATYPPFNFYENGKAVGYSIDYIKLIAKYMNVDIEFVSNKSWHEHMQDMKEKKLDIIPHLVVNEERKKYVDYTSFYHLEYFTGIAIKKDSKITSMKDLKGKRVGIGKSTWLYDYVKKNFPEVIIVPFSFKNQQIQHLASNRIDAYLGSIPTMNYFIQKHWISNLKTRKIDDLGMPTKVQLPMAVKKNNKVLLSILEKANAAISYNEIVELQDKWIKGSSHKTKYVSLSEEEKQYLENKKVLNVQNLTTFPPFNFNENGQAKGYSMDYMKLIGKYLNIKIAFIGGKTWNEYLPMLEDKTLDIIPHIAITEERKKFMEFTNFNHIQYTTGLAIQKDTNIKSIKDLENKSIAVVDKTFLQTYIKENFPKLNIIGMATTNRTLEAVSLGEADAALGSLPSLQYYKQKNWFSNVDIVKVEDLGLPKFMQLPMGVAKGNTLLKSILEKVNAAIPHNEIVKLKEKWMANSNEVNRLFLNNEELAYLNRKKVIKMCVLPNWLPFEQIDENGKHKGIGADIMKLVSKEINTTIELFPTKSWAQSLQNIRDRKCDILPVAMDIPSRRDAMNFTKPYVAEPFVIATKMDELFIKDSKAIGNRRVGIVKSYAFIEVLKARNPEVEIISVKNAKDGLERVRSGELFGYIDIMPAVGYTIQKYSMLDLKIAGRLEFDIKLSVASRNDEPQLNAIMQKVLNNISEEQIRTIVGRWIAIKVQESVDYSKLIYLTLFFLLLMLLVLYKNRSINIVNNKLLLANKQIKEQQEMVNKYVLLMNTDLEGVITNANEAYCNAIGYKKEELIGRTHKIMRHPTMSNEFFDEMWETITSNETWQGEIKNYTKNKEIKYFNMYIEPLFQDNKKIGYKSICEDITDKKRVEELSIRDKLTGLFNRLKLDEIMFMRVEEYKRYKTNFSLILLDLDNFKKVNDNYGHDLGDIVLQKVAKILKTSIRITDVAGRWGGEEFLVICENTNAANIKIVAEHIRTNIEKEAFPSVGQITVSLGVTQFKSDDSINSVFKRVDNALYTAKNTGKNKTIVD